MSEGTQVDTAALTAYARQLGFYDGEADKFGTLIDAADVTGEAWGVVGAFAKQGYTDRLGELRALLEDMKSGVDTLVGKVAQTARMYEGVEEAGVVRFGRHQAEIEPTGGR